MKETLRKLNTWWWYHRVYLLIGAAVLLIVLYSFLPNLLRAKPDYTVAIISANVGPEGIDTVVSEQFEALCTDKNGDGKVVIDVKELYSQGEVPGGRGIFSPDKALFRRNT